MSRLSDRLAALPTMPSSLVRQEWVTHCSEPTPPLPADLLRRLLAQRLQEKRYGGLPAAVARELHRVAEGAEQTPTPASTTIRPGARLIREWQGRTISVEVDDDGGFIWEGRNYRSLSRIAAEVTGAHWSGPRFFGVRARG